MATGQYIYLYISGAYASCKKAKKILRLQYCMEKPNHTGGVASSQLCVPEGKTIDECLLDFSMKFIKKRRYIKKLSEKCSVKFYISLYPEKTYTNLRLSSKTLHNLSAIGIDVELCIAELSDLYTGTDQQPC